MHETIVYFVRHAESDLRCHDDETRPLTAKGLHDRDLVTAYLLDKGVQVVCSSPYRRARDTVGPIAKACGLPVCTVSAFAERRIGGHGDAGDGWIDDFDSYCQRQWADFDFKLPGGESLAEVQARNVAALQRLLYTQHGKVIVVGTHGTALSTVIHHYDPAFGYADFRRIQGLMPWIVEFTFAQQDCLHIAMIDLFQGVAASDCEAAAPGCTMASQGRGRCIASRGGGRMNLTAHDYGAIRRWMYRNARPLDLARWRYHFERGAREDVLLALAAYQNADGGMGHALEADSWNPYSTPIQCSAAIEVLREVGVPDKKYPLVSGLLHYLASKSNFVDGRWLNTVPSNNDYPHASWWHNDSVSTSHSEFNPSAILAGFILECAERDSEVYRLGLDIAHELATSFMRDSRLALHPLLCMVDLLGAITRSGLEPAFDYDFLVGLASERILDLVQQDAELWSSYGCRPSHFVRSPAHPLYAELEDLVDKELEYLVSNRNAEGVWNITWSWAAYPREFAISERWWEGDAAIRNVLFLDAFGRIER